MNIRAYKIDTLKSCLTFSLLFSFLINGEAFAGYVLRANGQIYPGANCSPAFEADVTGHRDQNRYINWTNVDKIVFCPIVNSDRSNKNVYVDVHIHQYKSRKTTTCTLKSYFSSVYNNIVLRSSNTKKTTATNVSILKLQVKGYPNYTYGLYCRVPSGSSIVSYSARDTELTTFKASYE